MKRIYACIAIVVILFATAFYSSYQVECFAADLSQALNLTLDALRKEDVATARQQLSAAAIRCNRMRKKTNHLLRTEDFSELEAALCAADGHLEKAAFEEAFGELRRAQVQVETLAWLARRLI